jgi:hypothetical protein
MGHHINVDFDFAPMAQRSSTSSLVKTYDAGARLGVFFEACPLRLIAEQLFRVRTEVGKVPQPKTLADPSIIHSQEAH